MLNGRLYVPYTYKQLHEKQAGICKKKTYIQTTFLCYSIAKFTLQVRLTLSFLSDEETKYENFSFICLIFCQASLENIKVLVYQTTALLLENSLFLFGMVYEATTI